MGTRGLRFRAQAGCAVARAKCVRWPPARRRAWLGLLLGLGLAVPAAAQAPLVPRLGSNPPHSYLGGDAAGAPVGGGSPFDGGADVCVLMEQEPDQLSFINKQPPAKERVRTVFWGSPNIVNADPADYPRPRSLENDNPRSFWYSQRPNIFNVPVTDEWDFYNIINTDRPDFTDAVYTVGKGVTISENGYTFHKINDANTHISTRQLPESLIRYGVTNEFELRVKWNGYLMTDIKDQATGAHDSTFGGQDLDLGFKWELLQQNSWRPMVTVVSGILVPSGTRGVSANRVEPHFNLLAGWGIRRWLYIKWQTGCDFLNVSNTRAVTTLSAVPGFVTTRAGQNSWHESISVLTQWTKRVGAFHEWFMISNTGSGDTRAQHFLDMGAYIYATPNVQFDIRIGKRISDRVNEMFTGGGLSLRW
ncbi:MAG TPA: transporter [Pirellulales bacterium]|nr:transporter [Pirellulales bacterium]